MKKYFLLLLSFLSKQIIKRHKPFVVGVTWTVGKTTVTNFVYEFLKWIYSSEVYKSEYDYNWEFWLPLSILQSKSPNKNPLLWIKLLFKFIILYFSRSYPKYLVLEYWIDRPNEMEFLTDIVCPDIWIVLNVTPNHVTQFPEYSDYIYQKVLLWLKARKVIYNKDYSELCDRFDSIKSSISYSILSKDSKVYANNIVSDLSWIKFNLFASGQSYDLSFSLLWDHQVYNILPVFALWLALDISPDIVYDYIRNIDAQKWRWTILKWINDSIIIDWSYNWWFLSISSWVKYIWSLNSPSYKKVLFLWDMRELWPESKKCHSELAQIIKDYDFDYIALVWEEMKIHVFDQLVSHFWKDKVFISKSSKISGDEIRNFILANWQSIVYVKGSQNTIFLEEWIKKLLFDMKDYNKLCRQSEKWLSIKESFYSHII